MDAVLEHLIAFVEKVKDDPAMSGLFKEAASELYDKLVPHPAPVVPQVEPAPAAPAQVEQTPAPDGTTPVTPVETPAA